MKDSIYKILHIVLLIGICILLFRIGTELDKIADTIWRSNFE